MFPEIIFPKLGFEGFTFFDSVTVCFVLEPPFWPFVKKGDHLDPDFEKIISGNIFNHKEDTLGIILSPISGL